MAVLLNVYSHIIAIAREKSCIFFAMAGLALADAAPQPQSRP
jgi:hypothetical protein